MKRLIFIVLLSLVSCGISEIGGGDSLSDSSSNGVWGGPLSDDVENRIDQVCYVTAFDYQKGYDWRTNQAKENVKCSLVVYANGVPVMKVPIGESYLTGDDPDMHRILDGHLYTDYSTDTETVIKRDGVYLLSYQGRESICGLAACGDTVYTVGQNRDGRGFSYRKNGEIIVSRESGVVIGVSGGTGGRLSFAFYDSIVSSEGNIDRYYAVENGKVTQVAVREDVMKVWAICFKGDSIVYLASILGVSSPVLFIGNSMTALSLPQGAVLTSSSMYCDGDQLCVELLYKRGTEMYTDLWLNGVALKTFSRGQLINSLCIVEEGVCCTARSGLNGEGTIYRCGDMYTMPGDYSCMGNEAIAMVNGILHVGLSSTTGERPVLWKDGQLDTLKINGYISGIYAY